MVALIIDIQYYPVNEKHELKEATILPLTNNSYSHFVFIFSSQITDLTDKDHKTLHYINEKLGVIHHNFKIFWITYHVRLFSL